MKFCLTPRCSNRCEGAYCDACKGKRERERRGSSSERGYGWRWRTRALAFLALYPLCGMRPGGRAPVMSRCHDEGRVTAARVVDHVEPHRGDEGKFWDEEGNWQSQCDDCHNRKTQAGL